MSASRFRTVFVPADSGLQVGEAIRIASAQGREIRVIVRNNSSASDIVIGTDAAELNQLPPTGPVFVGSFQAGFLFRIPAAIAGVAVSRVVVIDRNQELFAIARGLLDAQISVAVSDAISVDLEP